MSPIRVDFYLLNDSHPESIGDMACRLLEKAYNGGYRVFVCCQDREEAAALDTQLWTYKAERFIPHGLVWENFELPPPIQLGCERPVNDTADLILNLASSVPSFSSTLRRIIEIVPAIDTAKAISREHYRIYRTHQFELHTHTSRV